VRLSASWICWVMDSRTATRRWVAHHTSNTINFTNQDR